jgi:hypothetical protein
MVNFVFNSYTKGFQILIDREFALVLNATAISTLTSIIGRSGMKKWERPPTQKGDQQRAADKRRSAQLKKKKSSINFFASLFGGKKK